MRDEFGYRRIDRDAALYGVVGRPVAHSLSPVMHNAAFRASGGRTRSIFRSPPLTTPTSSTLPMQLASPVRA